MNDDKPVNNDGSVSRNRLMSKDDTASGEKYMNMTKTLLGFVNRVRPLLLKLVPHRILRSMKRRLTQNSINHMTEIEVKPFGPARYPKGMNLIGNIKAESGLGQSCRLVANELQESGIDFSIYCYEQVGAGTGSNSSWDDKISNELPYNINLIHINPYELGLAFTQLDRSVWDYRYNIAFWLWELEDFPEEWTPCFSCLDEIWTPSEFISDSIRKKTNLPVRTMPYCVTATIHKEYGREFFGLPKDRFLFLTMYDHNSILERKNPKGVLEAFKEAFGTNNQNVAMVVKVSNPTREDITLIKDTLGGSDNVYVLTGTYDKGQVNSLIQCSDVLVSLHRAEGFGLVLAEAMLLGTPTVATNWSSNTEFMNPDVACMVDYQLTTLDQDRGIFKKGNHWADPDIGQAANYMRKLYSDREYYDRIAKRAKSYIEEKLSMKRAVELISRRINEIGGRE